jgi:L-lactate dehydrogenase complex protein LldG
MTAAAREEILTRIRTALASAPARTVAEVPRGYARSRPRPDLIEHFIERVADYGAAVVRLAPPEVPAAIAAACERYGARTLVTPADAPADWTAALDGVEVRRDDAAQQLSTAELDQIDATLSGSAVAIAETGTIVLDSGERQGRRALTLVPDVFVCVVRTDQVVDDVPSAVGRLSPDRPLTWISGPSATSDIELERVPGVHGPRILHVLLVEAGQS